MTKKSEFDPSRQKVLGVSNNPALGRAMEIMLKAVGYGEVEIVSPVDVCKRVKAMKVKPDIILFTQDYLLSTVQEKLVTGCPCNKREWCGKALTVMLLRHQKSENVFTSKEMGFDDIVFADASLDKMREILERVHFRHSGLQTFD